MMGPTFALVAFMAGAGTFFSGFLLGSRVAHLSGHYAGVQDALDALDDGRADS